ncbi:DUF3263 domain-containing protein [Rarobacter faecitabidus]|nr:DUF3263 domain-containing protein [Rarobacter faecitabidus]
MTLAEPVDTAAREIESDPGALSELELAILEFERGWWRFAGAKEQAIATEFDLSPTQYYQVLNRLIDQPAALAAQPLLVKRLRRLRDARQRERTDGRRRRD